MAGQQRNMEGDNKQRRRAAKEARDHGQRPSEAGVTLGASKQRRESSKSASHEERLETRHAGKRGPGTSGKPKPGSRDTDPKRTNDWK